MRMSDQAIIIAEIQATVMKILESGTATEEQADRIDELEEMLYKQKSFREIKSKKHTNIGEEIATLFFEKKNDEAIQRLCAEGITPSDFFGFVEYFYDDEHEDYALTGMFFPGFVAEVTKVYEHNCTAK